MEVDIATRWERTNLLSLIIIIIIPRSERNLCTTWWAQTYMLVLSLKNNPTVVIPISQMRKLIERVVK